MTRLLIDTDAGIDDAEALMMALSHPGAQVEAITTVTGNVRVEQVNKNVCAVLTTMDAAVPVYSGAALPLVEAWQGSAQYHLADGLGAWDQRPPCEPVVEQDHAANALVRLAADNPGELTLVALGPLTNIALAVRLDPQFSRHIKRFVFMGGAANAVGNTHRMAAEFNIGADPEAAHIVLSSFPEATMLGWEATLAHPIPWEDFDTLCALPTPRARFFRGITEKVSAQWRAMPGTEGHLLPDPLAMAVALEPSLILEQETHYVVIELGGSHARGQTIVNYTDEDHGTPSVHIVRRINMEGVYRLFAQMLGETTV